MENEIKSLQTEIAILKASNDSLREQVHKLTNELQDQRALVRIYEQQLLQYQLKERNTDKELDGAIKILNEKYAKAKSIDYISNPKAYALYHTWKEFDTKGGAI